MSEVVMTLARLPFEFEPPPGGVTIRRFRDGDAATWLALQASTGIYDPVDPGLFVGEFGDCAKDHADRILFAEVDGAPVGVSAVWFPEDAPTSAGRVHWVAVRPDYQRRGIGRALVGATLARAREMGYASAYLTTGERNGPAIALYRGLGFER